MVTRTVSGAHYGVGGWLVQRVTAIFMALYTVVMAVAVLQNPPADYDAWRALFEAEWSRYATLLFALSVYWHAWIGVRDILMDYVKPTGLRLGVQAVAVGLLFAYTLWTVDILWRLP